jgi:hypothetical protein
MQRNTGKGWCLFFSLLLSCTSPDRKLFTELEGGVSGVDFVNQLSPTKELNILTYLYYYNGAGVGVADFNGDELLDIYLVGNQVADKLYLNLGDLSFQDITAESGLEFKGDWTNGISCVDINGDGKMDFYLTQVGQHRSIIGQNLLFVNTGNNAQGIPQFKEVSKDYGLDIIGFSTQAAFFDYDLDGDLDMFLLNHSVYPNRSYGSGSKRSGKDEFAGDRLFENENGFFIDVSERSGIYQGSIGYGLGLSIADLNKDGYPDIYVGNDFFENDYLYLNQGDKTFKDLISEKPSSLGHTSHYSMGNNISDMDNDGRPDILSLDMLPEDLHTYKTSGMEDPFPTYDYYLKNGYAPQYMQNTLHWNEGDQVFLEGGHYSGISATEWSWSVLAEDFDLDGFKDLFITNGIIGATNDMDFISFIAQEKIQRKIEQGEDDILDDFVQQLPEKKTTNYAYRNNGNRTFSDVSSAWMQNSPSFSSGAVSADLDDDGDLDLVINNTNQRASILINSNNQSGNYLKFRFKGDTLNRFGIGAEVDVYTSNGHQLHASNYPVKSFLSSHPPEIVLGLDSVAVVDSITVKWPGELSETLYDITTNQVVVFDYRNARKYDVRNTDEKELLLNANKRLLFRHKEQVNYEFDREILIPYSKGHEGPKASVVDFNNDGLDDIFIGGAKRQAGQLFIQNDDGTFISVQKNLFEEDAISEDTDQVFFDIDNDQDMDLVIVSGGNEFQNGKEIRPRLYLNENGVLTKSNGAFQGIEIHAGVIKTIDHNQDGWMDLLIGANTVAWEFGKPSRNYVLTNNKKNGFIISDEKWARKFESLGLIEEIVVADLDGNTYMDIIAVGHWMPITLLFNSKDRQDFVTLESTSGWWNSIISADFDQDGDMDIMAGNWGLNTRLKASPSAPIRLYRNDFDDNGKVDPILTYYYKGEETVLASKDELVKQLPHLNKEYLSYSKYGKANLDDLLDGQKLKEAEISEVNMLASMYFENDGSNNFEPRRLPLKSQLSSVHTILLDDFNGDGFDDALLAGNSLEISTQLGRLDASHGVLLLNDGKGFFEEAPQSFNIEGSARDIEKVVIKEKEYYLVAMNNAEPILLTKGKK